MAYVEEAPAVLFMARASVPWDWPIQRRDYHGCALYGASIHTLRVAHLAWVLLRRRSVWRGHTYLGPRSSNVVPVMGAHCVERT